MSACLAPACGPAFAGPFEHKDPGAHLIPADKKLSAAWIKSLYERSAPEVYSGWDRQLKYVGMPIGGIGCGQLYLGGDGRLWLWDIFKSNYRREPDHGQRLKFMTLCGHYTDPVAFGEQYNKLNGASVEQGFAVRVRTDAGLTAKTLDHHGFPQVTFRGEYPVARVAYLGAKLPLKIELEAFSPFIPLNAAGSALPATIMSFRLVNTGTKALEVDLGGWLQNATCPYVTEARLGRRVNAWSSAKGRVTLLASIESQGPQPRTPLEKRHGYGSMALSLLEDDLAPWGTTALSQPDGLFEHVGVAPRGRPQRQTLDRPLLGALGATVRLKPGESRTLDFAITWYFPDYQETEAAPGHLSQLRDFEKLRRHYAPRFDSAAAVADYLARNKKRLLGGTRKWNQTWYDSTLPHWFLDRTFVAIDCAATNVLHWFDSGRLYAWEGVDCYPGTCTHVWHYAQALSRVFPELERAFRSITDYGIAFDPDNGLIGHRAENAPSEATDGQAGTILRTYREHLMSADDTFLRSLWPRVKKSIEFLIAKDGNGSGLIEGKQPHTLDAAWFGPMGWISGLYLAVLAAGEAMAREVGEEPFATRCRQILDRGQRNIVTQLFDGEYFIHKPDPKHPKALRSGPGCHIDQVLGQAWAHQVGLGRVIPKEQTVSALKSLWKYNFAPDAGGYALKHVEIEQTFRWYAMPGEAGLVMCTWPKGGAKQAIPGEALRPAKNPDVWTGPGGYFNECMNGFEYQAAAHMIAEGEPGDELVERGLAIVKAIHERYAPDKRNPFNEIECSDHYARSMASFGAFLSACGYEHHGPKGWLGFAPKVSPDKFKAAFTSAEGWGSYEQGIEGNELHSRISLHHGRLRLTRFSVALAGALAGKKIASVVVNDRAQSQVRQSGNRVVVTLDPAVNLREGHALSMVSSVG